jgi:hypothetical protein
VNEVNVTAPRKKVLVISFSQSGQLRNIVRSFLAPLRENPLIDIVDEVLRPVTPFPFPWSPYEFIDVFPESYQGIPCALAALKCDGQAHYDLVILAYQVWYLAPSIPVSTFLQSDAAKACLKGRPVVTIVACRNMWYRAHATVKEHLLAADARLIGHVALTDKAFNLVSLVTTVYWLLTGKRERLFQLLPTPGVSETDIRRCSVFAKIVESALLNSTQVSIQERLNAAGACRLVPHLVALERLASRAFGIWSNLIIRSRGARKYLVIVFGLYLVFAIAVFVPLSLLLFYLTLPLRRGAVQRQMQASLDAS